MSVDLVLDYIEVFGCKRSTKYRIQNIEIVLHGLRLAGAELAWGQRLLVRWGP